jgi:hypothetical protein
MARAVRWWRIVDSQLRPLERSPGRERVAAPPLAALFSKPERRH